MVSVFQVMYWYTCVGLLLISLMTSCATSAEDKSRKRQKLQAILQAREKDPNFGRNWNRNRDAPPSNFLPRNVPYKKSNATQAPGVNKRFPTYKTKEGKGWKPLAGNKAPILTVTSGRPRVTRATLTVVTVKRKTKARRGKVSRPNGKRNNKNRKKQKSSS